MHFGQVQPHALPGVAVNGEAALVNMKQHPAVFVLILRAPAGSEAQGPRVAAPGPGAFGAFGVGAAVSVGRGAGHGGAGAGDAEGCAGGVCSRAQRGDQRLVGAAFSMPLAAVRQDAPRGSGGQSSAYRPCLRTVGLVAAEPLRAAKAGAASGPGLGGAAAVVSFHVPFWNLQILS